MYRYCFALLVYALLTCFSALAQDSLRDPLQVAEIQRMIDAVESQQRPEYVRASLGEITLEEGLWLDSDHFGGELLAFDAIQQAAGVELIWTTASEYNSEYFSIERLQDDNTYASITMVKAAGHSSSIKTYRFVDQRSFGSQSTYRLRQVDRSGLEHISPAVNIRLGEQGFVSLRTSNDAQSLDIQTDIKMVRISITDEKGAVVVQAQQEDDSFTRIDIGKLKPGQYAVKVEDGDQVRMMEFEKKK